MCVFFFLFCVFLCFIHLFGFVLCFFFFNFFFTWFFFSLILTIGLFVKIKAILLTCEQTMEKKKKKKTQEIPANTKPQKECDCIITFLRNLVIDFIWMVLVWSRFSFFYFHFNVSLMERINSLSMY